MNIKKSEEIFKANSEADSVYFVGHGAVDILDDQGNTIIRFGVNNHFGELGVLRKQKRRYHQLHLLIHLFRSMRE